MDLQIQEQHFLVTGASQGMGLEITKHLLAEGAYVTTMSRTLGGLEPLRQTYGNQLSIVQGDVVQDDLSAVLTEISKQKKLQGLLLNAGGPPTGAAWEVSLPQWDEAYRQVLRWKLAFIQTLLPHFQAQNYGRILFIESISVKQPIENLVLSNAFRAAVIGYMKTLALEIASKGITCNALAPGFHNTAAMQRLFARKSADTGMSEMQAQQEFAAQIPVGSIGNAGDLAKLATWLFSPHSRFITGQTISVDGGINRGLFG